MSKFDEKTFIFFTDPENWSVAIEIYDRMGLIKTRLVDDFWREVNNGIDINKSKLGWQVIKHESGFGITYPEWNDQFKVAFGRLTSTAWLGIWCNSNNKEISNLYQDISKQLKAVDKRFIRQDSSFWSAWFNLDDFNQTTTLDKILPSRKTDLIQEYISIFTDIVIKVKPVIDNLNSKLTIGA